MVRYKVGIIVSSDKGSSGEREDKSGALIHDMVTEAGFEVASLKILPDDREKLSFEMVRLADALNVHLILTTGGTGFSLRDVTPEATRSVVDREAPGIAEAIRMHSLSITPRAMLSRGYAGIRGRTLIVNLPGSPKAVKEALEYIMVPLKHGIEILMGDAHDCATPLHDHDHHHDHHHHDHHGHENHHK